MMIYHNGNFISVNSLQWDVTDRGLLLGDGLFETMRAQQGKVLFLESHWRRLHESAAKLEIPMPISLTDFWHISSELLEQNNLLVQNAFLRFTLTRGCGPRGLLPPLEVKPNLIAIAGALATPPTTVSAAVVSIQRNAHSVLTKIKSLNYLENVLAKMEAQKLGADEAILLNSKNDVAGASTANIFLVSVKGQLLTPRIEDGALPGITRAVVIKIAADLKMDLIETTVSLNDLNNAAEIFLTNSLMGLQQVNVLNHYSIVNKQQNSILPVIQGEYRNRM